MESLEDMERELFSQSLGTQLNMDSLYEILKELRSNKFPTTKWFMFGFYLGLEKSTLEKIQHCHEKDFDRCLLECLERWLKKDNYKKGEATWDTLGTALEEIGEKYAAFTIREKVKKEALQKYDQALSQALVTASQLLYSEKCINEETLDEMENLEGTTRDKKTALLEAIRETLSSNCEKLRVITSVMSKFKETKCLHEKITAQYGDMDIPLDVPPVVQQAVPDNPSDILRCHYGKLSRFLEDPIEVAKLLTPQVISQKTMESIESSRSGQESIMLLKAIRSAVHINKDNLELFVRALKKVPQNNTLAEDIWKDFVSVFSDDLQLYSREEIEKALSKDKLMKSQVVIPSEIYIPRCKSEMFMKIRMEFGIAFTNICTEITKSKSLPPFSNVKMLLRNCFPHMKEIFDDCHSIDDLLAAVRNKCTIINISCIENLVKVLEIKDAETHIQTYRETLNQFCKEVSVKLCLQEKFHVANVPSPLQCEKIDLVLDWKPDQYTLDDIRDTLSFTFEQELSKEVYIHVIKPDDSITVTCTFPLSLTSVLVAKAQKTVELLKMKGLIQLTIGHSIIFKQELDITKLQNVLEALHRHHFRNTKWFPLGLNLGLLAPTLEEIKQNNNDKAGPCLRECLSKWLTKANNVAKREGATWETLIEALKSASVEENAVADSIIKDLALEKYINSQTQTVIYPVEVFQFLYSDMCISETTLDKIESTEGPPVDMSKILLAALHGAKKLSALTTVLSKFEETKPLSNKIIADYDSELSETPLDGYVTPFQSASDILRHHYGNLSQSLCNYNGVAEVLYEEDPELISQETLASMESSRKEKIVLLSAIRRAVRQNDKKLEVVVSVLLQFSKNVPLANAMWKDYKQIFKDQELELCTDEDLQLAKFELSKSSPVQFQVLPAKIRIPRSITPQLKSIRMKFEQMFYNIRLAIIQSLPFSKDLKMSLGDCLPDIRARFDNCNTTDDTLSVVHDKCTLIDISCLEAIVKALNINNAQPYIEAYNTIIEEFCQSTSLRVCLKEKFQVEISPPPLQRELATFAFDWNPEDIDNYTLKGVLKILSQLLGHLSKYVKVIAITEDNSIVTVTCTISHSVVDMLISNAKHFLEETLTKVTIGHCIIFDKYEKNKMKPAEVKAPESDEPIFKNEVIPTVNVTPEWLYRIICEQKYKVPVVPALLMTGGLMKEAKRDLVERFVNINEERPHGFAHYEIITPGLSPKSFFNANRIRSSKFYDSIFLSCLNKILMQGVNENGDSVEGHAFYNEKLKEHLHNMVEKVRKTFKAPDIPAKMNMEIECFIKVWDLTFNSIAYQFLHCFAGYLHNSYMWLFPEFEDSDKLHRPPQFNEGTIRRSRLEYFLCSSKLSSCFEENDNRKRVCKVFTNQSGHEDMKLNNLGAEYLHAAAQLGVQEYIDGEILPINFAKTHRFVLLDHLKQQIKETPDEIPLSFLFLRGALDLEASMFMTYDELKQKAKDCGIKEDESFKYFCNYFTSFGSILNVKSINPKCDIVIIKPDEFLSTLDQAFAFSEPTPDMVEDLHKFSMNGIITEKLAHNLFEDETDTFIEVLEAVGLVAKVNCYCSDDINSSGKLYYMPSARQCEEVLQYNQKAVQLITSIRYPSVNMEVALSKYILDNIENATNMRKVTLRASKMRNISKIHFEEEGDNNGFIEIVYQGGVIEFIVESINPSTIVEIIVNGCKKIAKDNSLRFGEPKYHFAVLCTRASDNREFAYNFTRKRHRIPYNQLCCQCPANLHLKAWNEVLAKMDAIPDEFKLNGDLTAEDVTLLATTIAKFPLNAVEAFCTEISAQFPSPAPHPSKWWCYLQTAIITWMTKQDEDPERESTTIILARSLIKLHDDFIHDPKSHEIKFKMLARRLDLRTLTPTQVNQIKEFFLRAQQPKQEELEEEKTQLDLKNTC